MIRCAARNLASEPSNGSCADGDVIDPTTGTTVREVEPDSTAA
ncbi:MAG: hypothetical protein PF961_00875 [Planctomycetota bacterium]|nr:hypothetical protein [Planctomycetota bacterium]